MKAVRENAREEAGVAVETLLGGKGW